MEWALTRTLKDLDVATTATHTGDGGTTEYIRTLKRPEKREYGWQTHPQWE